MPIYLGDPQPTSVREAKDNTIIFFIFIFSYCFSGTLYLFVYCAITPC
ncbi:hypothetical protein IFVP182_C1280015 [Vibrio parahaemolyticus]